MATYIVRSNEIGKCVRKVIADLNAELWELNKLGPYGAEMPQELKFDMIVVEDWEALESTDKKLSITSEIQGGFQTETRTGSTTTTDAGTDAKYSRGTNVHNNSGDDVDKFYEI
jgi:hypothetical protein